VDRLDGVEGGVVITATALGRFRDSTSRLGDPAALRREAAARGFLFFRRLIDPAEVLELRSVVLSACRDLDALAEGTAPMDGVARPDVRLGDYDDPRWVTLQCRVMPSREFRRLGENPAILGVLEALFEGPAQGERGDTCRVFSPRTPELTTRPHQDRFYVRGEPPLWTAWIPLGDCPIELGGLAVSPGSHREGLRRHVGEGSGRQGVEVPADLAWSTADYRCGDVLMFSGFTLHRGLENQTADLLRVSADFRFEASRAAVEKGGEDA
jgi:hypothetical protein